MREELRFVASKKWLLFGVGERTPSGSAASVAQRFPEAKRPRMAGNLWEYCAKQVARVRETMPEEAMAP